MKEKNKEGGSSFIGKLMPGGKNPQESDKSSPKQKVLSPREEINSIYEQFQNKGNIVDAELTKLRDIEKKLLNDTNIETPNSTWDTIIRLYDLSKNYNDILRLGTEVIKGNLGNHEAALRSLRVIGELKGSSEAYRLISELSKEKLSQLRVQELLSKFEYDLGKYHDALNRAQSLLKQQNDLLIARGILVASLVEVGNFDEACHVVMDAPAESMNFPWAIMKLLSVLSTQEKYIDNIIAISEKFLDSRNNDQEEWKIKILHAIKGLDQ